MARPLILVLGGTRSGKSRYGLAAAERLAGGGRAWFLATARSGDPELDDRIARHRRARPAAWPTVEVGDDLAAAIASTVPDEPGDPDPVLDGPLAAALDEIDRRPGPVVIVSDELGLGMVPMHAGARAFRDLVGLTHQRIAARADEAFLMVAGLPLRLKGGPDA